MLILTLGALALDQAVQWRYGAAGALAVALVGVGHRVKNTTFTALGLTALAVLLAQ